MSVNSINVLKRLTAGAFAGAALFVLPAYAIKWGQVHPHINWPQFLKTAWSVGLADSPLGHQAFYGAHFHWQELSCLLIFFLVYLQSVFVLSAYGAEDSEKLAMPRTKKQWMALATNQELLLRWGTSISLFLFIAACALCERIQLGTISGVSSYDSLIRDAGIVIETLFLFKAMTVLSESVTFNGMVVRSDVERCYRYVIIALVGLSLSFASWLPLLAIPGARIATTWIFTTLRETLKDSPSEYLDAEQLISEQASVAQPEPVPPDVQQPDTQHPNQSESIPS